MRFIETKKLNDYVAGTAAFWSSDLTADLSGALGQLDSISLQTFSIEHDRAFLREVAGVLNVVVSIIYHPHISNKREEVIIRIEQAQQIGREAFHNTMQDSKLWKEHDMKMVPEEVYYHQHIDELRIYENRFIGFLVDLIDKELAKFSAFYLAGLPSVSIASDALDGGDIGGVLEEIDRLRRMAQFIKGTYFYREVSKGKPISSKIQPTNILLKDRLYRYCFKFYKNLVRYEDPNETVRNLRAYYTILLFRALDERGFALAEKSGEGYVFENHSFTVRIEHTAEARLTMTVTCRLAPHKPAVHLLAFHVDTEKQIGEVRIRADETPCDSVDVLSAWEWAPAEASLGAARPGSIRRDPEATLIGAWLDSKLTLVPSDNKVYRRYCPVCRARGAETADGVSTCANCTSSYMFGEVQDVPMIWFRKIRK